MRSILLLFVLLAAAIACRAPSSGPRVLLDDVSGLEEVTIVSKGME